MTIQTIDTVTPTVGLKPAGNIINANFTNAAHAASYEVGTAAGQIPRNSDLPTFGNAAQADTGTATGQIPTADDLGIVGETNYTSGNYEPGTFSGLNVAQMCRVVTGTISAGASTDGSNLRGAYGDSSGVLQAGVAMSGTWLNVAGVGLASNEFGLFVRTS